MNILFLDDCGERHTYMDDLISEEHILRHAYNAKEAIEDMKEEMPDLLMLDHDLAGPYFQTSTEDNTGYKVACYTEHLLVCNKFAAIGQDTKQVPKRIVLHTINAPGAMNMMRALRYHKEVFFMPFSDQMRECQLIGGM